MDEQIHRHPVSQSRDVHARERHNDTAYCKTSDGGSNRGTVGTTYYDIKTGTDQQFSNTYRYNIGTETDHRLQNITGRKQSPNHDLAAGVGTAHPWYFGVRQVNIADSESGWYRYNQTSADANNYYQNQTGPSYQTIYDVNNIYERCDGSYPALTSTAVKGTSRYVNVPWTDGSNNCRNDIATQGYYGNTAWTDNRNGQGVAETTQGHDTLFCDTVHDNILLNGPETWSNMLPYCDSHQHQSSQSQKSNTLSQTKETLGGASRKRKLSSETGATPDTDVISAPKIDKRALYSKFRVVKKTDRSPSYNEGSKVTPMLWRSKLGDGTIVDVNHKDGLPINAKMTKAVPTLTPVKVNEAAATIGNIKFITLENMKIVRRKLEVVLATQQGEERQERLRLEAKVRAKVKVNAKERARKDNKRNDRKRHVKIGL